jgi:hypothetical protein
MDEVQARLRIRVEAGGLRRWAGGLEIAAVLGAIGGVIGAIVLIAAKQPDPSGNTTHPYVVLGIALAGAAIFWGVFEWCIARALLLFAESTALGHGVALSAPGPGGPAGTGGPLTSQDNLIGTKRDEHFDIKEHDLIDINIAAGIIGTPGNRKDADRKLRQEGAPRIIYDNWGRTRWSRTEVESWAASLSKE